MKIEVTKVCDIPIQIQEEIPSSRWEMDSFDTRFVDTINLDCSFVRISKEIIVDVVAKYKKVITCSRCLEDVAQAEQQKFQLMFNVSTLGEHLEIDDDIREQILLNFPMKVLCKPDCKGLCARCGGNLNTGKCKC